MTNLIKNGFASQVHRIIAACPSWRRQKTFDPIRHLVKDEDIYDQPNDHTFEQLKRIVDAGLLKSHMTGTPEEKILIIVDDLAGSKTIHGRGTGHFALFAVSCTHCNVSLFVTSQQPKRTDPAFRDNAENIIVHCDYGKSTYEWLERSYTSLDMDANDMKRTLLQAWRGGRSDDKERGQHFLFIHAHPRRPKPRFFIDFDTELKDPDDERSS